LDSTTTTTTITITPLLQVLVLPLLLEEGVWSLGTVKGLKGLGWSPLDAVGKRELDLGVLSEEEEGRGGSVTSDGRYQLK